MSNDTSDEETQTATVYEDKFNGTMTAEVHAHSEREAEAAARQYFKDVHGSRPSTVVAKKAYPQNNFRDVPGDEYDVMAADHSSGSMAEAEQYEYPVPEE